MRLFNKKKDIDESLLESVDFDNPHPQRMYMAELEFIESGRGKAKDWHRDNDADSSVVERQLDIACRRQHRTQTANDIQSLNVVKCAAWARQYYTQQELNAIASDSEALQDLYNEYLDSLI